MNVRTLLAALSATAISGCWIVTPDYVEVTPVAETYEACYGDFDCASGYCEEIAVPADYYSDYVNAICTVDCYDDYDCPTSVFNLLPGACIPHDFLGGVDPYGVCIERCETHGDCDVFSGFACTEFYGERLCLPSE